MGDSMLKAVIFDMDGVIIDSEPQHARAALRVFQAHGIDTNYEYCSSFIGSSTEHMAECSIKKFGLSMSPETLVEEMNREKLRLIHTEGYQPLPYIQNLLKRLHKAGLKLAIASSSSNTEIEGVVKTLEIRKYFHKLISSSHVAHPKPAPDTFELALKELGVNAKEAIVIEDSCYGTMAAKAAGIACIGLINPHSGNQDLSHADALLEGFEDLQPEYFEHVLLRSLGKPVTIASTRRLIIRELATSDIPDLYPIYQDPDVRKYIDDIEDYLEDEIAKQKAYIKNVYAFYDYGLWGVFSKTTKGLIGRCGIENHTIDGKEEIMLSYLLDSQHWGYGYALECCEAIFQYAATFLDIHRIVAVIDKQNSRSLKTAEKLGMKFEKELVYKNRDSYLYVVTLP